MIYFTADLHFGCKHILNDRKQFRDIEMMDSYIISRWNEEVDDSDEIYILGDLFDVSVDKFVNMSYLDKLNGRKHLIIGNHDLHWLDDIDIRKYFESIDWMKILEIDNKMITLCHFPMLEWIDSHRNTGEGSSLLLYGHTHDTMPENVYDYLKESYPYALNVGVDINNFVPVTFEVCRKNNYCFFNAERENI